MYLLLLSFFFLCRNYKSTSNKKKRELQSIRILTITSYHSFQSSHENQTYTHSFAYPLFDDAHSHECHLIIVSTEHAVSVWSFSLFLYDLHFSLLICSSVPILFYPSVRRVVWTVQRVSDGDDGDERSEATADLQSDNYFSNLGHAYWISINERKEREKENSKDITSHFLFSLHFNNHFKGRMLSFIFKLDDNNSK